MNDDDDVFRSLIPELADWNNGAGIDAESWVGCAGNVELAVGYSLIFWPKFVRFKSYIVRSGLDREDYIRPWEDQFPDDRGALEAMVNHSHIVDIHALGTPATEAQVRYLGRLLKEIHRVKLNADFPDIAFEVNFNDEPGLSIEDYQLTFWQTD